MKTKTALTIYKKLRQITHLKSYENRNGYPIPRMKMQILSMELDIEYLQAQTNF